MSIPFHLAFSVKNIKETKRFYVDVLGCAVTKSTDHWLNINFFGHQLSIHENPHMKNEKITNNPEANNLLHYEYRKPWTLD